MPMSFRTRPIPDILAGQYVREDGFGVHLWLPSSVDEGEERFVCSSSLIARPWEESILDEFAASMRASRTLKELDGAASAEAPRMGGE